MRWHLGSAPDRTDRSHGNTTTEATRRKCTNDPGLACVAGSSGSRQKAAAAAAGSKHKMRDLDREGLGLQHEAFVARCSARPAERPVLIPLRIAAEQGQTRGFWQMRANRQHGDRRTPQLLWVLGWMPRSAWRIAATLHRAADMEGLVAAVAVAVARCWACLAAGPSMTDGATGAQRRKRARGEPWGAGWR